MRWDRIKNYLRENWGAPFVIAFIILLIISAAQLSFGLNDAANETAVYAFYALVLGVALQIASYVKYGEGEVEQTIPQPQPSRPREGRKMTRRAKTLAVGFSIILVSAAIGAIYFYYPAVTEILPHQTYPQLVVHVSFNTTIAEPDGTRVVTFGLSATGGNLPYNFTAVWSDNFTQTNTSGVFSRTFPSGVPVPSQATVQVKSSDGQVVKVKITIPAAKT